MFKLSIFITIFGFLNIVGIIYAQTCNDYVIDINGEPAFTINGTDNACICKSFRGDGSMLSGLQNNTIIANLNSQVANLTLQNTNLTLQNNNMQQQIANLTEQLQTQLQLINNITAQLTNITEQLQAVANIGEFVSSVVLGTAPISLTSGTPVDVTSISLSAGDWDVYGNIFLSGAGGTSLVAGNIWSSLTSMTMPEAPFLNTFYDTQGYIAVMGLSIPTLRYNVNTTTTVYLSTRATFASTCTACGGIYARRVR